MSFFSFCSFANCSHYCSPFFYIVFAFFAVSVNFSALLFAFNISNVIKISFFLFFNVLKILYFIFFFVLWSIIIFFYIRCYILLIFLYSLLYILLLSHGSSLGDILFVLLSVPSIPCLIFVMIFLYRI